MKRIVVTGGAGFIGSHLMDKLLSMGHHVICIDNLQTGSITNIQQYENKVNFEFIEHDIVHPLPDIDEIYNLACAASPVHYQANPIHTFKTNVLGALNMLELATKKGVTILQASTSEV